MKIQLAKKISLLLSAILSCLFFFNSSAVVAAPAAKPAAELAILDAPAAPTDLVAEENSDDKIIELSWHASSGAASYNVYRSLVQTTYSVSDLVKNVAVLHYEDDGKIKAFPVGVNFYYYVVTAVNSQGVESAYSNEVGGLPHYRIGWSGGVATYQPADTTLSGTTVSSPLSYTLGDPDFAYHVAGEVFIRGETGQTYGPEADLVAQFGYGPVGVGSSIDLTQWTNWANAAYFDHGRTPSQDHDRYVYDFAPQIPGSYYYTYRFTTTAGREWHYPFYSGADEMDPASIPVNLLDRVNIVINPSDTNPPTAPTLSSTGQTKTSISLSWTASSSPDIYAYDVYRSASAGSLGTKVNSGLILAGQPRQFTDTNLVSGTLYYYRVVAMDYSYNQSQSNQVSPQTVSHPINFSLVVTIPAFTPSSGSVYLSRVISGYHIQSGESWSGTAANSCDYNAHTCIFNLAIEENSVLNFRISRGSLATVHTLADGNGTAIDPSFTVTNGLSTVSRVVANWDDPLPVSYSPTGFGKTPYTHVSITWNQAMAADTTFVVKDMGSSGAGPSTILDGSIVYIPSTFTVVFRPNLCLDGRWNYQVEAINQMDVNGLAQQSQFSWTFITGDFFFYFPLVQKLP
jgi:hypothetical protein